jgi:hypothetical protein
MIESIKMQQQVLGDAEIKMEPKPDVSEVDLLIIKQELCDSESFTNIDSDGVMAASMVVGQEGQELTGSLHLETGQPPKYDVDILNIGGVGFEQTHNTAVAASYNTRQQQLMKPYATELTSVDQGNLITGKRIKNK